MKLVIGLGNYLSKYLNTRHNVGFLVLDSLVQDLLANGYTQEGKWQLSKKGKLSYLKLQLKTEIIELIKPQTFVNESGLSVGYAYKKHSLKPDDLYVVHDDLDIPLGSYKMQLGKGPKSHNGLLSIYEKLGTKNFWHVRVGVENRATSQNKDSGQTAKIPGEQYVLGKFSEDEKRLLDKVIFEVVNDILGRLAI